MSDAPSTRRVPPTPHDPAAARRLSDDVAERGAAGAAFAASPSGAALLAAFGGHSPFLADLALRETAILLRFEEAGADAAFTAAMDPLGRADTGATTAQLGALLRGARRRAALVIAAADLTGAWGLDQVTGALSTLGETAIDLACAHLLREAAARGDIVLPSGAKRDPKAASRGSGLVVLGMGKLGGRELNYSSDVDLMVLFDPAAATHRDRAQSTYVRLARDLVKLMEERTAEGYVFRTDLRLRPDPAATPLAVSVPAAIAYYESFGQNWERAAMLKARPVAGDRGLGEHVLSEIRPFVWRRHLDFAMIADIHSIKRQIHAVHASKRGAASEIPGSGNVAGHDVKLGRGGIREIEFTAQVAQLIWGGRDPSLRDPTTLGAIAALARAGRMDRRAAAELADAYVFLRDVEHRLQMVADRQTHRIPEDEDGLARIASFMGYDDTATFASVLTGHLARVAGHYARQFEGSPSLTLSDGEPGGDLVFTGAEDDPGTIATLARMGYANPSGVSALIRAWHHGRRRATRSERARELLTALMPAILSAFARAREPDAALARFDALLERLPAGVQLLSMFHRNHGLLERVAGVLGAAPALADHLARVPSALEGLLTGGVGQAAAALPALVGAARHYEEALESARRLITEGKFEVDVAALEGALDADAAGAARGDVADAAISALLPVVSAEFATRHGKVPGGAMAVVAMGKLGGREMLPGSDLDLILIYDHAEGATESDGARPLPVPTYYARLAAAFVAALTAPGAEGKPYEVDMRLRPTGNKGPVATSIAAFERYHGPQTADGGGEAWTWERMALTRARPVAGPAALRRRIAEACRTALAAHAGPAAIPDALAMRTRLLRDLPPEGPWDVKAIPGGLVEVEFVAQALQCAHAASTPGSSRPPPGTRSRGSPRPASCPPRRRRP
jgi:glutamate-ammonia-ligase adenylyltransferase